MHDTQREVTGDMHRGVYYRYGLLRSNMTVRKSRCK
jgi:hypothetical protein